MKEDSEKNGQGEADRNKEEELKVSLRHLLKDTTIVCYMSFYANSLLVGFIDWRFDIFKVAEEIKADEVAVLKVEEDQVCLNCYFNDWSAG